jgi:uncharacterized protein YkwD
MCKLVVPIAFLAVLFSCDVESARRESPPVATDEGLARRLGTEIVNQINKTRSTRGVPSLSWSPEATEAARLQVISCVARGTLTHDNPSPGLATVFDRLINVGSNPSFAAELLATDLVVVPRALVEIAPSGTTRETRTRTSSEIAASLVVRWLESPAHRSNLLHLEPAAIGCAVTVTRGVSGAPIVYCSVVLLRETDRSL